MSTKTFSAYVPTEPVEFNIGDEHFNCVGMLPGVALLDFMSSAGGGEENPAQMAAAVMGLLRQAIAPEDLERFEAYISDPANGVSVSVLSEIAGYVADKLSGVDPTKQSATTSLPG